MAPRSNYQFGIVASQYNLDLTQPLADFTYREITQLEQGCMIQLVWAPGTFELPVLAKLLAAQAKYDVILALGVLIQGETAHAGLVAQSTTQALQTIALTHSIPVIDGIIYADTAEQARVRCTDPAKNRGVEAARAAVSIARTVRELATK
jgi:6,7-dimethyl-8-ribityllumazine synthase